MQPFYYSGQVRLQHCIGFTAPWQPLPPPRLLPPLPAPLVPVCRRAPGARPSPLPPPRSLSVWGQREVTQLLAAPSGSLVVSRVVFVALRGAQRPVTSASLAVPTGVFGEPPVSLRNARRLGKLITELGQAAECCGTR